MTKLLIPFLLLAACNIDTYDGHPEPFNQEVDPPEGVEEALEIVYVGWSSRLQEDLEAATPDIRWYAPEAGSNCLRFSEAPPTTCFNGMFSGGINGSTIFLIHYPLHSSSALAHELLHWTLSAQKVGAKHNSGHQHPMWSRVVEVQQELRSAGM